MEALLFTFSCIGKDLTLVLIYEVKLSAGVIVL